jgi:hypothetical protein
MARGKIGAVKKKSIKAGDKRVHGIETSMELSVLHGTT